MKHKKQSKKPLARRKAGKWLRPSLGTHLDRNPKLDPKHPKPHEIGEKRGTGKAAIKVEVVNTIRYILSDRPGARTFTHHTTSPKTFTRSMAKAAIQEWLGLAKDDYLDISGLSHMFIHDVPKSAPLCDACKVVVAKKYTIIRIYEDGDIDYLFTYGPNNDEVSWLSRASAMTGTFEANERRLRNLQSRFSKWNLSIREV